MLCCSQFSKLTVACQTGHLLKKFRMANPPERRGDW
uniref:Uncharacterized protein n=1 Tax=Virus sp. ctAgr11 TaxID=2825800 RepID=A0A8S5RKC4_9VIRU|nr:MAG TPA: hypothetical protein [Virus sp. ctAgr11]